MIEKDTGGPAFSNVISLDCVRVEMDGSAEYEPIIQPANITVLDYFAAKAMQAIIGNDNLMAACNTLSKQARHENPAQTVAEKAYAFANQMIKERAK